MTEKLYYRDAYATKFTARVLDCTEEKEAWTVILNRTLFYPEGGGQPADIGVLGGVRVLDVHERGEDIVHTTDKPLPVGAEVEGEIDWEHRFDLMQNHSGEHILSGVICGRYGCDNVGFHMGKESITIDLNTKIPAEDLPYLEEKANEYYLEKCARRDSLSFKGGAGEAGISQQKGTGRTGAHCECGRV